MAHKIIDGKFVSAHRKDMYFNKKIRLEAQKHEKKNPKMMVKVFQKPGNNKT